MPEIILMGFPVLLHLILNSFGKGTGPTLRWGKGDLETLSSLQRSFSK